MKQHLLVKGFLLPTLSTLILFICFSIHLVCISNYDQNYVCNHRLYVCIIPKNQAPALQRNHIIATDQKSDLLFMSFK